ncbi:Heat shock 70 kDa protein 12A, partial [Irineochytrium annulatum]
MEQDCPPAFASGPTKAHKVIIAIDIGTCGSGYSYAFPSTKALNPDVDIYDNRTWPGTNGGKTATAILLKRSDLSTVAFGVLAIDRATNLSPDIRGDFLFYHQFKMQLYDRIKPLRYMPLNKAQGCYEDLQLLDDETGHGAPAYKVVGAALRAIKNAAMEQVTENNASIKADDVLWVLTVRSKEEEGELMRLSAIEGGLVTETSQRSLLLALESEAASVSCLADQKLGFKEGDVFAVADCGGGTLDVTALEVTKTGVSAKKLFGVCQRENGSTAIDVAFVRWIDHMCVRKAAGELKTKHGSLWYSVMKEWERKKCSFTGDDDLLIAIPNSLLPFITQHFKNMDEEELHLDDNNIVIPASFMTDRLSNETVITIVNYLETICRKVRNCKYLVVVGNFARFIPLQAMLRQEFEPCIKIIVPTVPGDKVLKGAAMLGNPPTKNERLKISLGEVATSSMNAAAACQAGVIRPLSTPPPTRGRNTVSLFVTYCWKNSAEAFKDKAVGVCDPRHVRRHLEKQGYSNIWQDTERLHPGEDLFENITNGLKAADVCLICVSDEYAASENCLKELNFIVTVLKIPFVVLVVGRGFRWKKTKAGLLISDQLYIEGLDADRLDSVLSEVTAALDHVIENLKPREDSDMSGRPVSPAKIQELTTAEQHFERGVQDMAGQKYANARRAWVDAMSKGHPEAGYKLYGLYKKKVLKFFAAEDAVRYLHSAADREHSPARAELGRLLLEGKIVTQNIPKAFEYLELAAEDGDADALMTMASHWQGDGKDLLAAEKCLEKAAKLGRLDASAILERDVALFETARSARGHKVKEGFEESDKDRIRIFMVGGCCGKTTLLALQARIEVALGTDDINDFFHAETEVDGKVVALTLISTKSGYDFLTTQYYLEADVFLEELRRHASKIPYILVGLQKDRRGHPDANALTPEQGERLAKRIRASGFLECSAYTGDGVTEVFQHAARVALEARAAKARAASAAAPKSATATPTSATPAPKA